MARNSSCTAGLLRSQHRWPACSSAAAARRPPARCVPDLRAVGEEEEGCRANPTSQYTHMQPPSCLGVRLAVDRAERDPSSLLAVPDCVAEALCDQPVQAGQRRVRKGRILPEQQHKYDEKQGAQPGTQHQQGVHAAR